MGVVQRLTELYLQLNQLDRLLERLERERHEAEKQREMTFCLAQAYAYAGDYGTARQQLERLLTENPRDTQLLGQLAQMAENEGDSATAAKYQRQLVKAAPTNRDAEVKPAQILVKVGESDEAAQIWVKLATTDSEPHRALQAADSLLQNGKFDTVLAITRKLLLDNPRNWEAILREGLAHMAMDRPAEAEQKFQAVLALRLPDDEASSIITARTKKSTGRPAGAAATQQQQTPSAFQPPRVPLQTRTENIWELRQITGIESRYSYGPGGPQRAFAPNDFGHARMAALGCLFGLAPTRGQGDDYLKTLRAAHDKASAADPRASWDWYYLSVLKQDPGSAHEATKKLVELTDPTGQLAFLNTLGDRTAVPGRVQVYRRERPGAADTVPPLPPAELERVLTAYRKLRNQRPDWMSSQSLSNVLKELKRSKRTKEEDEVFQAAVDGAALPAVAEQILRVAADRGDVGGMLRLLDKLEKMQSVGKSSYNNRW